MTEARMPGQPEVRDGKQQQLARTFRLQAKTTSCRAWKPVLTTEPGSRWEAWTSWAASFLWPISFLWNYFLLNTFKVLEAEEADCNQQLRAARLADHSFTFSPHLPIQEALPTCVCQAQAAWLLHSHSRPPASWLIAPSFQIQVFSPHHICFIVLLSIFIMAIFKHTLRESARIV